MSDLKLDVAAGLEAADEFGRLAQVCDNDSFRNLATLSQNVGYMSSAAAGQSTPDAQAAARLAAALSQAAAAVESFDALTSLSLVVEAANIDAAVEAMRALDEARAAGFEIGSETQGSSQRDGGRS